MIPRSILCAVLLSGCSFVIELPELPPLSYCGDGNVDDGEECDDANDVHGDGCNPPCKAPLERGLNSTVQGGQSNPRAAFFENGALLVGYDDDSGSPPDLDGSGTVRVRHFEPIELAPTGLDFAVSEAFAEEQEHLELAAREVAVVIWEDRSRAPPDPDFAVRARVLSSTGGILGRDFVVTTSVAGDQNECAIASGRDTFLVVWTVETPPSSIRARLLDAAGTPFGTDLAIASPSTGARAPAAAGAGDRYLVAWSELVGDSADIRARFISDSGTLGPAFTVNSTREGSQTEVSVGFDPDSNRFLVAWADGSAVHDTDQNGIRGRIVTGFDAFAGEDFPINEDIAGQQELPSVSTASSGVFMVVWTGTDADLLGVRGRRLDADGTPLDGDTIINTITIDEQKDPYVTVGHGGFFVVWEDESTLPPDGDDDTARGVILPIR